MIRLKRSFKTPLRVSAGYDLKGESIWVKIFSYLMRVLEINISQIANIHFKLKFFYVFRLLVLISKKHFLTISRQFYWKIKKHVNILKSIS
jgi:hypothetical protein